VIQQVFSALLGIQQSDKNVNDNTIEAAIKLMTKIGYSMEGRIAELKDPEKSKKMQDQFNGIFARLTELKNFDEKDEKNRASPRIKILI
jgi:hypothetical protein